MADTIVTEEWRPVVGAEGFYAVSNLGRVKRTAEKPARFAGRMLKGCLDSSGYSQVRVGRSRLVHHLVYEAFAGPRPEGSEINHRDGVKTNNRVENLELVSHAENMGHASRTGLMDHGEGHPQAKLVPSQVVEIKRLLMAGISPNTIRKSFGVNVASVWHIATGMTWKEVHVDGFVPVPSVRCRTRSPFPPEKILRGERSGMAKLTEANVRAIRAAHLSGEFQASIARRFNVSQVNVSCIVRRKTWGHVD
jgi:hypothetical protein